jgi:hypothetical protein
MTEYDPKADLHRYLQDARDSLLWKLDGLGDTFTFGRPCADQLPWDESDPMSDMFAVPSESREFVTGLYRRAWAHSDDTIDALPGTPSATSPGGRPTGTRSRCTTSWSVWPPRPPATPTSSVSSSTARLAGPPPTQPPARRPPLAPSPPRPRRTRRPASRPRHPLTPSPAHPVRRPRKRGLWHTTPDRGDRANSARRLTIEAAVDL